MRAHSVLPRVRRPRAILMLAAWACLGASGVAQSCQPFRVLVFWKTAGFTHASQIALGITGIHALGMANGFAVDDSNDATLINPANLSQYAVIVFLYTTGDILDATQQTAFESWSMGGGGFVGIHSATDTEYGWPFYGALIGAYFANHPAIQQATVSIVDATHPSTSGLPGVFTHTDEWYNFQSNPASNPLIHVLATIDETTYVGGTMGAPHPIAWYQDHPGMGRSWYSAFAHVDQTWLTAWYQSHLLGGIRWAADSIRTRTICGGGSYGAASGSPPLVLGGVLTSPTSANLIVSGGSPGGSGLLGVSSCVASVSSGSLTILIDLASPGFIAFVPVSFDAAGQWQLPIPLTVQVPGSWGNQIVFQGADLGPAVRVSNGFGLLLCN